ncbi:MAG: hypothetical protein ACE5HO_21705 [bacterium]
MRIYSLPGAGNILFRKILSGAGSLASCTPQPTFLDACVYFLLTLFQPFTCCGLARKGPFLAQPNIQSTAGYQSVNFNN